MFRKKLDAQYRLDIAIKRRASGGERAAAPPLAGLHGRTAYNIMFPARIAPLGKGLGLNFDL
jgi:hypothetical protein